MKKNKVNLLIIGGLVTTLTTSNIPTFMSHSSFFEANASVNTSINSEENNVFKDNYTRYLLIEQQGKEIYEQRLAEEERIRQEELRIEQERLEQERLKAIEEENRIANVHVNLDNVLEVSNINVDELIAVFDFYDYSKSMKELAYIIVEAERTYGINAFVISGIISWESDYNKSARAQNDNNVLGWSVYSPEHEGAIFDSKYQCIMNACEFLRSAYLTEGGLYYNGLSTWSIAQSYCNPSEPWRIGVNTISYEYLWVYKYLFADN